MAVIFHTESFIYLLFYILSDQGLLHIAIPVLYDVYAFCFCDRIYLLFVHLCCIRLVCYIRGIVIYIVCMNERVENLPKMALPTNLFI